MCLLAADSFHSLGRPTQEWRKAEPLAQTPGHRVLLQLGPAPRLLRDKESSSTFCELSKLRKLKERQRQLTRPYRENFLKLQQALADRGYFLTPRRRAAPACGQNIGLPRTSWGLCLPFPCPSREWSSEDFKALSRHRPSFPDGGAAAEDSRGGQRHRHYGASLCFLSPGREA